MGQIILEIQHPDRPYAEIIRLEKESILIGRSFNSDVYCPDQYVSETHAKLQFDGQDWLLSDAGSANGVFKGKKKIDGTQPILFGEQFSIGNTKITLSKPDHPVSDAIPMKTSFFTWDMLIVIIAWTLTFSFPFVVSLEKYLNTFTDDSFLKLLTDKFGFIIVPVLWAFIWAGISKLIIKKANFHIHLLLAASFCLMAGLVYQPLNMFIKYNISNDMIFEIVTQPFILFTLIALLYLSLRFSTHVSSLKLFFISSSIIIALFIIINLEAYLDDDFRNYPKLNSSVICPELRLKKAKSLDSFMSDNEKLFKKP